MYLRQRCFDGSVNKTILKPRLAAAAGRQYVYVRFSRRKIPRSSAYTMRLYDIGESNRVPASGRAQKLTSSSMSRPHLVSPGFVPHPIYNPLCPDPTYYPKAVAPINNDLQRLYNGSFSVIIYYHKYYHSSALVRELDGERVGAWRGELGRQHGMTERPRRWLRPRRPQQRRRPPPAADDVVLPPRLRPQRSPRRAPRHVAVEQPRWTTSAGAAPKSERREDRPLLDRSSTLDRRVMTDAVLLDQHSIDILPTTILYITITSSYRHWWRLVFFKFVNKVERFWSINLLKFGTNMAL